MGRRWLQLRPAVLIPRTSTSEQAELRHPATVPRIDLAGDEVSLVRCEKAGVTHDITDLGIMTRFAREEELTLLRETLDPSRVYLR